MITDEFVVLFLEGLDYHISGFHNLIRYTRCMKNVDTEKIYGKLFYDPKMISTKRYYTRKYPFESSEVN